MVIAVLASSFVGTTISVSAVNLFVANRKHRNTISSLNQGSFKAIALPAAQEVLAIGSAKAPLQIESVSNDDNEQIIDYHVTTNDVEAYLLQAELPKKLHDKSKLIINGVNQITSQENLSVEDTYTMEVVAKQLLSSIRLYESLVLSKSSSKEAYNEFNEQLDLMLIPISHLEEQTAKSILSQLRVNTLFLRSKFKTDKNLTLN